MSRHAMVDRMRKRTTSLQSRITAIAMLPAIALALLVGGLSITLRKSDLDAGLRERGMLMARQLASAADYGVFSGNLVALQALAESVASERATLAVAILDRDGEVLASTGKVPQESIAKLSVGAADTLSRSDWLAFSEPIRSPQITVDDLDAEAYVASSHGAIVPRSPRERSGDGRGAEDASGAGNAGGAGNASGAGSSGAGNGHGAANGQGNAKTAANGSAPRAATAPVAGRSAGTAVVVLSTDEIRVEQTRFAITVIGILAIVLLFTGLVARRMSRRLSRPVVEVAEAAERIGRGESGVRVSPSSIGALDLLGRGVNEMAERLERSMQDLEQRVQDATRQLVDRKEEAENANRAKSKFLAAASHDLRQPMHALGMFVATLAQQPSTPMQRQLIAQIDRAVGAMGDLLDSLLDISRLDAGVIETRIALLPLRPVLDRIASEFAPIAEAKGLELVVRRTSLWVRSDRILLDRILMNLASNAVRYTERGRVVIAARICGPERDRVRIDVRDSGPGIPEEAREAIFDEFVQLGNPERDRGKGLGLGLAIVKRLVTLLDHRLELRSAPGVGSTFSVVLPRVSAEAAERAETVAAQMAAALQQAAATRSPAGTRPAPVAAASPTGARAQAPGRASASPTRDSGAAARDNGAAARDSDVSARDSGAAARERDPSVGERDASIGERGAPVRESAAPDGGARRDARRPGVPRKARRAPAPPAPASAADDAALLAAAQRPFAGRRILVIDDDALVRDSLAAILKSWGALVAVSAGQPSLPQQLANAERPELILCDLRLGDHRDGVGLLAEIRTVLGEPMPAVMITGDTDPERVRLAGRSGDPVLHKPVRPAQLRALLHGMLRRTPSDGDAGAGSTDAGPSGDDLSR